MATFNQVASSLRCPPPSAGVQTHRRSVRVLTTRERFGRPTHLNAGKPDTSGKEQSPERKEQLKKDTAEENDVEPPPADGEGPPFSMKDLVKKEQSAREGKKGKKDEQKPSSPSVGEEAGVEDIE